MDAKKVFEKLVQGIKNYFAEAGCKTAVLGASGGIDSAVVAVLAQQALGPERVFLAIMPSKYSSPDSARLATNLAENLQCNIHLFPIQRILNTYNDRLSPLFGKVEETLVEENLQARIRANLIMACTNRFNCLALATGNKSEAMVGYCTLFGDTVGALAPIGELYKTEVYELAHYINRDEEIIPIEIIERPPSAELSPGQKDTDTLPPYDVLDPILKALELRKNSFIEFELFAKANNFPVDLVRNICHTIEKNKFKARYYAPAIKWRE